MLFVFERINNALQDQHYTIYLILQKIGLNAKFPRTLSLFEY
jgi:hypothetical protein